MSSAKEASAAYNMQMVLIEWDRAPKEIRWQILKDFIAHQEGKSSPDQELEMAQMASLFLARISVWLKLTYMSGLCLTEQLQCLHILLSAAGSHNYINEFLEHGGILCLLEVLILEQSREVDKLWAAHVLHAIGNAGIRFKEVICESYGIRALAQGLANSKCEVSQEACRTVLECLARANPRFDTQVYKALIGILPCRSPKAQTMALQTLRIVQLSP